MGSFNISVYVKNDDLAVYADNVEVLNQVAREAFEKKLCSIKESIRAHLVEDCMEDSLHTKIAINKEKKASDRLYGTKMRHEKGKGVE
jgi:hypothetical protein